MALWLHYGVAVVDQYFMVLVVLMVLSATSAEKSAVSAG